METLRTHWAYITLRTSCACCASFAGLTLDSLETLQTHRANITLRSRRACRASFALNTLEPLLALQTLWTLCAYRASCTGFALDSLGAL